MQPDQEEYQVLIEELGNAKTQRAALQLAQAYEQVKFEPGPDRKLPYPNLLSYMNRGNQKALEGRRLREELEANRVRVAVLELRLADWNLRTEAYQEWVMDNLPQAKDPK